MRKVVLWCLLLTNLISLFACREDRFLLPGELVLSRYGWDHITYFDGLHYREVKLQPNRDTDSVSGARVGPGRSTYAIGYTGKGQEHPVGNSVVTIAPSGVTSIVFRQKDEDVVDFATTPTQLVVLTRADGKCPNVKWASYQGRVLKVQPAPCAAAALDASTPEHIIVATDQEVLLRHGDTFKVSSLGNSATWINPDELMYYEENTRCTWKYDAVHSTRVKVFCGEWFANAASPDGRYILIRVLTTEDFHDIPELRILDTRSGHHISVIRGALPGVSWTALGG
jgi:hypothetical protein